MAASVTVQLLGGCPGVVGDSPPGCGWQVLHVPMHVHKTAYHTCSQIVCCCDSLFWLFPDMTAQSVRVILIQIRCCRVSWPLESLALAL